MFSLAHACLCLKCVMGSQRRDVVVVVVEEEKEVEEGGREGGGGLEDKMAGELKGN